MSARRRKPPVHMLSAYTWAGRRAECAVTSEWLNDTEDWAKATCSECLKRRPEGETPGARPMRRGMEEFQARIDEEGDPRG